MDDLLEQYRNAILDFYYSKGTYKHWSDLVYELRLLDPGFDELFDEEQHQ